MNYTPLDTASFTVENKVEDRRKFFIKIFLIVIILLGLVFFGSFTAIAYTNFRPPFISPDIARRIKVYYAFLPFLPKTKEQVVLATAYKSSKINSFALDSSGALTLSISSFSVDIDFNSKNFFDFSDKKAVKETSDVNFSINILGTKYALDLKGVFLGKDIYFKIENLSENLVSYIKQSLKQSGIYLSDVTVDSIIQTLTSDWIKIERGQNTPARKKLDENSGNFKNSYKDIALSLLDSDVIKNLNFTKDGSKYKLYKSLNGREIAEVIKKSMLKKGKVLTSSSKERLKILEKAVKKLDIETEIDKNYVIRKISVVLLTEFKPDSNFKKPSFSEYLGGVLKIDGALSSEFSSFNKKRTIEKPKNYKDIQQIYLEIQKTLQSIYMPSYSNPVQPYYYYNNESESNSYYKNNLNDLNNNNTSYSYRSPTQTMLTIKRLVNIFKEYKLSNGRYPDSLEEYFSTNSDFFLEKQVDESQIIYVPSEDRMSYVLYAPYMLGSDQKKYLVYSSASESIEILSQAELSEKISTLRKDVLGIFFKNVIQK